MDFRQAVAELDVLVRALEREGDQRALRLLELVDAIHRPGLEAIAAGQADHPLAKALLAMYDLVPIDDALRVEEALDMARQAGVDVQLAAVDGGTVRVRLADEGAAATVEEALRAGYPPFERLVVDGAPHVIELPLAGDGA